MTLTRTDARGAHSARAVPPGSTPSRRGLAVTGQPRDLAWFFGLTFALTWGIAALVVFARPQVEALTGPFSTSSPLYFLAVYAPSLTAVTLTAVREGRPGLRALGRRLLRWRVNPGWYALVLLGWPVADVLARLLQHLVTGEPWAPYLIGGTPPTPLETWYLAPPLLLVTLALDAGPLGEEVGWRGYALPRLFATRLGVLVGAGVLGVVWGLWHLPAFLISGTHQHDLAMGFGWLVIGCLGSGLIMAWLYLRTGSVLVSGLLVHLMTNCTVSELWAFVCVLALPAVCAAVALARHPAPAAVPR